LTCDRENGLLLIIVVVVLYASDELFDREDDDAGGVIEPANTLDKGLLFSIVGLFVLVLLLLVDG
jgi:hypothetical protein